MEASLHLQQGLTLLEKVLRFYPIVREGDKAQMELTQQDWLVLMDFVENPESSSIAPKEVSNIKVYLDDRVIKIKTDECEIEVAMGT